MSTDNPFASASSSSPFDVNTFAGQLRDKPEDFSADPSFSDPGPGFETEPEGGGAEIQSQVDAALAKLDFIENMKDMAGNTFAAAKGLPAESGQYHFRNMVPGGDYLMRTTAEKAYMYINSVDANISPKWWLAGYFAVSCIGMIVMIVIALRKQQPQDDPVKKAKDEASKEADQTETKGGKSDDGAGFDPTDGPDIPTFELKPNPDGSYTAEPAEEKKQ